MKSSTSSSFGALQIGPLPDRAGVCLRGEIDVTSREVVAKALAPLVAAGTDVYLDLSRVTFADVSGTAELVTAAQRLGTGHRLVLECPPPHLRRILDLWWSDLCCIEVVSP
jgi:anti-anti-sigma factor